MAPSHVLVPLDGSPMAEAALTHALETFECRVTVLNVVTSIDAGMSEGNLVDVAPEESTARERAEEVIDDATAQAEAADREIETVVRTGDPADVIHAFVTEHDVDHVVMGSHGGDAGRIARRLLGTVATAVVGEVPVPVTVVR
ncbi:universal stress protein [Halorhabdus rudnickae]|uniref:universal stress protein n=1 Tax=Halorhabdus rudnickae TaxID=1775544 RepID=UPI0010837A41|nr:universal stress protein [Halorhabdus rudnickae]